MAGDTHKGDPMTGYEGAMCMLFLIGACVLAAPSLAEAIGRVLEVGHKIAARMRDEEKKNGTP